jgi:hypothetical protein
MAAKGNRSDLNNPAKKVAKQAARGQTYGEGAKQMRAQEAVPMAPSPTGTPRAAAPQPQGSLPGRLGAFTRPSERPSEPLTAGADFGAGPNSVQAGMPFRPGSMESAIAELKALYEMYPSDTLGSILETYYRGGY